MKPLKSILLVEDDKDDQEFFIRALSKIKNATLYDIANNGKEALEKLENPHKLPDLIFMDINMPMMNGIECLNEIIKNPHTKNIAVIILATDTWQTQLLSKLGAKAIIKKPADIKILQWLLQRTINSDFGGNIDRVNRKLQVVSSAF